jgi:hypothetical protein
MQGNVLDFDTEENTSTRNTPVQNELERLVSAKNTSAEATRVSSVF